jgi:hypothetical protein
MRMWFLGKIKKMPAKDIYHNTVKNALIKDGWTITDDSLFIQFGEVDMYIDIGAERIIAAENGTQKIAVEIKSFLEPSLVSAFHTAMGQYIDYRHALEELQSERILYLAVPQEVYETFFTRNFIQSVINRFAVKLIIYSPPQEVIIQWQN